MVWHLKHVHTHFSNPYGQNNLDLSISYTLQQVPSSCRMKGARRRNFRRPKWRRVELLRRYLVSSLLICLLQGNTHLQTVKETTRFLGHLGLHLKDAFTKPAPSLREMGFTGKDARGTFPFVGCLRKSIIG